MQRLRNGKRVLLVAGGVVLGSSAILYQTSGSFQKKPSPYHEALDERTFTTWRLIHKELVSATNTIFTLAPPGRRTTHSSKSNDSSVHESRSCSYDPLWKNGTWSVTIKQPQLQVAREYTPLPPLPHPFCVSGDESSEQERLVGANLHKDNLSPKPENKPQSLRFLIRKDGETSAYIHQRSVDHDATSAVEVRGPTRELETLGLDSGGVEELIFLAGGTGIAPAMQLAHGLLLRKAVAYETYENAQSSLRHDESDHSRTVGRYSNMPATGDEPRMTILWANRNRQECEGGATHEALQQFQMTWWQWMRGTPSADSKMMTQDRFKANNPIVAHLRSLERSFNLVANLHTDSAAELSTSTPRRIDHGASVGGVDTEHQSANIRSPPEQAGRAATLSMTGPCLEVGYFVDAEKTFISKSLLRRLVTRPSLPRLDRPESSVRDETAKKRKFVIISGPDGFVDYFAGPRELVNGRVAQGKLGGVLGELKREGLLEGWDVVKM